MFHKGRWEEDYKVFVINKHLRFVWFTPYRSSLISQKDLGFHLINGGGIRHISGSKIREIVW